MAFPRPLILSAFFRCASAFFLLGPGVDAHERENHDVPAVNPNPQRLVIGANPLEVESGRLHVYCLEVPASGVSVTCETFAIQPFTFYQSQNKQPVLTGGEVTGASRTEQAEAFEVEGGKAGSWGVPAHGCPSCLQRNGHLDLKALERTTP